MAWTTARKATMEGHDDTEEKGERVVPVATRVTTGHDGTEGRHGERRGRVVRVEKRTTG